MGKIKDARRMRRKIADVDISRTSICAWPAGKGDWRIQSRIPAISKYLASSLKMQRCAFSVLGGHLNIFRVNRRGAGHWATRFAIENGGTVLD